MEVSVGAESKAVLACGIKDQQKGHVSPQSPVYAHPDRAHCLTDQALPMPSLNALWFRTEVHPTWDYSS